MRAALDDWVERTEDLGSIPESELAERYWPGGEQPVTPAPTLSITPNSDGLMDVTIRASVEGASIAYAVGADSDAHWKLYVEPFAVPAGATLRARAVRYGWAGSPEVRLDATPSE